jgi:hypothetical protein
MKLANFFSEEHYRRSSDCSFFVFAQPPGKKGKGRAKKPRVSKASSRLSTQSVGTVASETPEVDMDDSMDQSMMSQSTTKSKSTKKSSKGKGKGAKSKKEEPAEVESHMETESAEVTESEPAKAKHTGRGKKRASEDITKEDPKPIASEEPEQAPVEPPAKRRATRTRSSSISRNYNYDRSDSAMLDADTVDEGASEEETKRGRKPTKKGASRARKVSDVSVTSKPVSKARIPRDSEIEAEIEAGLDADIPESIEAQHEPEPEREPEPEPEPEQPRVSKKAKATKKSKAVAKSPEPTPQEQTEDAVDEDHMESEAERVPEEVPEPPAAKNKTAKGSKKKGSKKAKAEETKAESQEPQEPLEPLEPVKSDDKMDSERHESFISVEIINKEPEPSLKPEESVPEPDDSEKPAAKPKRKGSKKKDASVPKEKKSKKLEKEPTPPPESPIVEHDVEPSVDEPEDGFETVDDLPDQLEVVQPPQESSPQQQRSHRTTTNFPPKTAKRYSDIPQEEHLAETIAHSSPYDTQQSNRAVSPLPSAHRSTPSMSPQSSDAENRPPSSRPSASRANDQSTPQEPKFRAALTASTPSPSKRNANAGFGPSGQPWTPIDIDDALFGDNSDKENADLASLFKSVKGGLTSPEKKMTVQEWIAWNAKNGEERLKRECERLVGQFEKEGGRAMQRIEAIECID